MSVVDLSERRGPTAKAGDGGDARYRIHEGDLPLSVPGQWEDQSLNVLRLPGAGHAVASLVVSRDDLPVGLSVPAYTERELHRLAKDLPGFELKARIPVDWPDGRGEAL